METEEKDGLHTVEHPSSASSADPEETPRDRVIRLRDFLAALPPERFNIATYTTNLVTGQPDGREDNIHPSFLTQDCGTAACVAGWACALFNEPDDLFVGFDAAASHLGLDWRDADELFTPHGFWARPEAFPVARAIAVLDHYLATGKISWNAAK